MKTCRTCGQVLEATLENFYRNNYSKDGLDYLCKKCKNLEKTKHSESLRDNIKTVDGVVYKHCDKCGEWKERATKFEKSTRWYRKDCIACRSKAKRDLQKKRKLKDKTDKQIEIKRETIENAAYKRMIAQTQDTGLASKKLDIELVVGKSYIIKNLEISDYSTKYKKLTKGVLIQLTSDIAVFKTSNGYCTSFMIKDVLLGECELKEAM